LTWLFNNKGNDAESWVAWADREQEVRRNASMWWGLIPSARLVAVACTAVLVLTLNPLPSFEASYAWCQALWSLLPPMFHMVPCLLLAPCQGRGGKGFTTPSHIWLVALMVPLTCVELGLLHWYRSSALAVVFHKYVALRFFLEAADGVAAHRPGGCCLGYLHKACRLWTLSWRFPRDMCLGLLLSVMNIILSSVPYLGRLHSVFLFHTRPQDEERNDIANAKDEQDSRSDSSKFGEGGSEAHIRRLLRKHAPHCLVEAEV